MLRRSGKCLKEKEKTNVGQIIRWLPRNKCCLHTIVGFSQPEIQSLGQASNLLIIFFIKELFISGLPFHPKPGQELILLSISNHMSISV